MSVGSFRKRQCSGAFTSYYVRGKWKQIAKKHLQFILVSALFIHEKAKVNEVLLRAILRNEYDSGEL